MWFWGKKNASKSEKAGTNRKVIPATVDEIRDAIRAYEQLLPDGVTRAVLVGDDHAIRFDLLEHELGGIPDRPFYMSKLTYEIFEEDERELALWTDTVQAAVDQYIEHEGRSPILPDDPDARIDVHLLYAKSYLHDVPPMPFYLTDEEHLISREPPRRAQF